MPRMSTIAHIKQEIHVGLLLTLGIYSAHSVGHIIVIVVGIIIVKGRYCCQSKPQYLLHCLFAAYNGNIFREKCFSLA